MFWRTNTYTHLLLWAKAVFAYFVDEHKTAHPQHHRACNDNRRTSVTTPAVAERLRLYVDMATELVNQRGKTTSILMCSRSRGDRSSCCSSSRSSVKRHVKTEWSTSCQTHAQFTITSPHWKLPTVPASPGTTDSSSSCSSFSWHWDVWQPTGAAVSLKYNQ